MPTSGSRASRCWTPRGGWADARTRALGGAPAAGIPGRIGRAPDAADDLLGPGGGAARLRPLARRHDRGRARRGDRGIHRGARPAHGRLALRGPGASWVPAELSPLGLRYAAGPLDRAGGV